jgi:hypothetical protein
MQLDYTETLGPVIADTWRGGTLTSAGPGTFVVLLGCPLSDTETMQVQVLVNPEAAGTYLVVENYIGEPADLSSAYGWAAFQSSPIPLVDVSWEMSVRAKHDSATDKSFSLRVIKL